MYKKKYSPEESLQRVKLMMGYELKNTLKENIQSTGVVINEQSAEEKIGDDIWRGAYNGGIGTDDEKITKGIESIKDLKQFWNVNAWLKKKSGLDIVSTINDEFGDRDDAYIQRIANHLEKLGLKVNSDLSDKIMGAASQPVKIFNGNFRILSSPASPTKTTPTNARQQNINNLYCSVVNGVITNPSSKFNGTKWENWVKTYKPTTQEIETAKASCGKKQRTQGGGEPVKVPTELGDVKVFQDWLDVNKPGWATGYPDGKLNKAKGYGRFGPRTQKAWASYKDEYLNSNKPTQPEPEVSGEIKTVDVSDANF